MYNLPQFKEKDEELVKEFMRKHSFATIIANGDPYPVATQVPLLIEERDHCLVFKGHVMRQTDHYRAFEKNKDVLCLFTGAHSYVSASWYTSPQVASTWNYMTVHAKGQLKFVGDEELLDILEKTTAHYEQNDASPASYHHLPAEYVTKLAQAIIGFEIKVKSLDHVFKLSQNRKKKIISTSFSIWKKKKADQVSSLKK